VGIAPVHLGELAQITHPVGVPGPAAARVGPAQ
jgi:hypothetical protein